MTFERWLPTAMRSLVAPYFGSMLCCAALAVLYGAGITPRATNPPSLFAMFLTVWVIASFAAGAVLRRRLHAVRALATTASAHAANERQLALQGLQGYSRLAARLGGLTFGVGGLVVAVTVGLIETGSPTTLWRIAVGGALMMPVASLLTELVTARAALVAAEALSAGLTLTASQSSALDGLLLGAKAAVGGFEPTRMSVRFAFYALATIGVPVSLGLSLAHRVATNLQALVEGGAPVPVIAAERTVGAGLIVGLAAVALVIALFAMSALAHLIIQPFKRIAQEATRLGSGALGRPEPIAADGESAMLARGFSLLQQTLLELLNGLRHAGGALESASSTLKGAARRYESDSTEQATSLGQTTQTTEALARSARQISGHAAEVQSFAQKTLEAAEEGRARAIAFQVAVDRMRQDNQLVVAAVSQLEQRVAQIGTIITVINAVADRSEGLAHSAEREGAKSGEVGRSFTIVAAEMRRLAEGVLESTAEVAELIDEIRSATTQTAQAAQKSAGLISNGTSLATDVAGSLSAVAQLARETSNAVRAILLSTQEQQSGTDQLAATMAGIVGLTQQGLAATQQLTVAHGQLRALSMNLSHVVDRFS